MGRIRGVVAFTLSMFALLAGVLVVVPVERAVADGLELGPEGYFSKLSTGATPVATGSWASTRRIVFGKQGVSGTYGGASVSGGYKALAKGKIDSVADADFGVNQAYSKSATTSVAANEALLWADDVVTAGFAFDTSYQPRNSFDSATGSYKSNLAMVSDAVGSANYSSFEQGLLRSARLEGVCTAAQSSSCGSGSYTQQTDSVNDYKVFPLSIGDVRRYFNHTSGVLPNVNLACPSGICNNSYSGSWLRSARWDKSHIAYVVGRDGHPVGSWADDTVLGLRPAVRLNLERLLLSAHSGNQSQVLSAPDVSSPDSLRLTFVDADARVVLSKTPVIEQDAGVGGEWVLRDLEGSSNLDSQTGLGWKLVDPEDTSGEVVASGRTNYDAAADSDGNMVVPCETLTPGRDYTLSVWGQEDGSDTVGWSNRATKPITGTVTADGDGVCALDIRNPVAYGISLTGQTSGALTAYRIGEYRDEVFDQTGALKSVMLNTPTVPSWLKDTLKDAVVAADGTDVDADNPIGWVASRWLGYPTDPLSDDVTSAFSPYAGSLQLFAQELAKHTGSLGDAAGSLPAGTFSTLTTKVLTVSGPGLYLIVDSTQGEGGSLPIIVDTKVFNEALEDVVEDGMVDFADAGVKGKPRLGRAVLKTSVTDVAKRVVNDAGLDGFDVGSEVEFEIALRVPDLSGLSGVMYDAYAFKVEDMSAPGLTLPQAADVRVLVDVDPVSGVVAPNTDVTNTSGLTIGVSGQMLTVGGLKAVFAEDSGGHVANKATIPAGSLMRIRYAAVLNAGASFSAPGGGGLAPNANTVTLTRSKSDGDTEQRTASAHAYSFKVDVVKVDKDDTSTALGDARFEVSRDGQVLKFKQVSDGVYRLDTTGAAEVTTHADGTLSLLGVQARELSFRETQAPDGYFKVSDFMVEVVPVWNADASEVTVASYRTSGSNMAYVSQDGRSVTVADPARSLANLPYTGGIGILLLLIVGGVFLVFAVRPYYLSHRAEATANILI
ncbi:MAG: hypothetical protein LKI21_03555 [Bifidobacterium crudilactis]|jgi:fimbrial isopeptide formation D2 family protein|nr:hypothetical protein [Bifidobacterium crudilactis]